MSGFDRRQFLKVTGGTGAVALSGLAGCSGGPSGDGEQTTTEQQDGGTTESQQTTTEGSDATNVGMVYATGGLGDGSFNDQAQTGLKDAASEWPIEYKEVQPEEVSDFGNYQQQFAQSTDPDYDLVASIGYLQADSLSQTASDFPDQKFMLVDETVDAPNVASYTFMEHEGSFLVGKLAGLLTTQDFSAGSGSTKPDKTSVGFVGGMKGALIQKFEAGYKAGVKSVDSGIDIQTSYVGSYTDPSGGKEAALAMYNNGADIVYHASGNTGMGVFKAAKDAGRFAIGVDKDQSITVPSYADVILASMSKRVDSAVYDGIGSVVNDEFEGGTVTSLGLEDDGVANVYGDQLGSEIPQSVKDAVATARQEIIDGNISVPKDPANV